MATFKPFKALRPREDLADKIAALPYDVYTTKEARDVAAGNPCSFLHIDKAEIDLDDDVYIYSDEVYEKAFNNYNNMIEKGWLIKDSEEAFYIYCIEMDGRKQTGIAGLASVDEYIKGDIKKHELTREDKENDRIRHIQKLNAQTGLIFLVYKADKKLKGIINGFISDNAPIYNMVFDDGTKSKVWRIADKEIVKNISETLDSVSNFFIADGHHRNAAAVKVGLEKKANNNEHTGTEPYNYCLSVLFPDDELYIMDYNRVVKDINGLTENEFLEKISQNFDIAVADDGKPKHCHEFGMYMSYKWYRLKAKRTIISENDALKRLDVSILQDYILGPVLEINDVRTNKRIDFIGGIRGLDELMSRVDSGEMKAGFAMFPTSMEELMDVAINGQIMPPKSTWFEPKLKSGIFIHEI